MPRASWKGFLRLSLVSCPVYLTPATTRAKPIRLHQVWMPRDRGFHPAEVEEDEEPQQRGGTAARQQQAEAEPEEAEGAAPPTRIALQPVPVRASWLYGA